MAADILDQILAYKRTEVAARKTVSPASALNAAVAAAPAVRPFQQALLAAPSPAIIAEIKRASPSKGLIRSDFDPPALASAYAAGGAVCLSVLTDGPSFQGHDSFVLAARSASGLPVLRKEFLIDPYQVLESRALGADCILLIMAAVDDVVAADLTATAFGLGMDVLVEVHDEAELERALRLDRRSMIGVNNRDLRSFVTDLQVSCRLARLIPQGQLLVSESGIGTRADIDLLLAHGAGAFLVGESLMRQEDVTQALRHLRGTNENT